MPARRSPVMRRASESVGVKAGKGDACSARLFCTRKIICSAAQGAVKGRVMPGIVAAPIGYAGNGVALRQPRILAPV